MSRSGYTDDFDDYWPYIRYRGAVNSAIRGKRGQAFLREMVAALDALPSAELGAHELITDQGEVCALGAVAWARGMDLCTIDPDDASSVSSEFGIAEAMAREIVFMNDDDFGWGETPFKRFHRMRQWAVSNLKETPNPHTRRDGGKDR